MQRWFVVLAITAGCGTVQNPGPPDAGPAAVDLARGCMLKAPTQQTFMGQLDNVTLWNRALTDAEIAQLYASG